MRSNTPYVLKKDSRPIVFKISNADIEEFDKLANSYEVARSVLLRLMVIDAVKNGVKFFERHGNQDKLT